jgi:hypothetical protein
LLSAGRDWSLLGSACGVSNSLYIPQESSAFRLQSTKVLIVSLEDIIMTKKKYPTVDLNSDFTFKYLLDVDENKRFLIRISLNSCCYS